MSRKVTRQSRVSMERIRTAANSRLMRLAQKMIVGGALLLDRVANFHLHRLAALPVEQLFAVFVDEVCRFFVATGFRGRRLHGRRRTGRQLNAGCYRLIDPGGYTGSNLEQSAMGDLLVEQ